MCTRYLNVKSSSYAGVKHAFVPCGKCADCRRTLHNAWTWRILSEFYTAKQRGWRVGFITLTYAPEHLPTIPLECFKNPLEYREIPCFSRDDVRNWIDNIRQHCKYNFGFKHEKNIRYFVCCEYGSLTKRPHYHALLAWQNEVNYEEMFKICKHYWNLGLVGPKDYRGDQKNLPFEVIGDCSKVFKYVSKYVTKDIDFSDFTKDCSFYDKLNDYEEDAPERDLVRLYKRCCPFHIQSRSFGFEVVKNLSDLDRIKLLQSGFSVVGDDNRWQVPLYISHKILFNNYYVIENGKRLVRRYSSAFFECHKREIFEQKLPYYEQYLGQLNREFLERSGVNKETATLCAQGLETLREGFSLSLNDEARCYLAYNGIDYSACYDIDPVEQWMCRFRKPDDVKRLSRRKMWQLIDSSFYAHYERLWKFVGYCYTLVGSVALGDRERQERLVKKIRDFFNNVI